MLPPSERRQASRPVAESNAKTAPPDAPNTNPPSVESSPLRPTLAESALGRAVYSHFSAPVAASSARTLRIGGSVWLEPLPTTKPFCPRVTVFAGAFVKTELLSVAGMKMDCSLGSKAGFCQFVPPSIPGLMRRPSVDTLVTFGKIGRPVAVIPWPKSLQRRASRTRTLQ